jgi:hypothetical protein
VQPGPIALEGAVVQPPGVMSGGDYEVQSGFWYGVSVPGVVTGWAYLPVIVKGFSLP